MTETARTDARADLRNRHLAFYLDNARRAEEGVDGEAQAEWIDFFASDLENLRSALRWAIDSGQADAAMELSALLTPLWMVQASFVEPRQWLEHALSMPGGSPGSRAAACSALAEVLHAMGEFVEAIRRSEEAVQLFDEAGDPENAALAKTRQGWSLWYLGKVSEAQPVLASAADALRTSRHRDWLELALRGLGWCQLSLGNAEGAVAFHEEGRRAVEESGNRRWLMNHLGAHATVYQNLGDTDARRRIVEERLGIARELGDVREVCDASATLVEIRRSLPGQLEAAEELAGECLNVARETGDSGLISAALLEVGGIASDRGDASLARTAYLEALDQSHRIREPMPFDRHNRARTLIGLASLDVLEGRSEEARRYLDEAKPLVLVQSSGPGLAAALLEIAHLYEYIDARRSLTVLRESLAAFEAFEDKRWQPLVGIATIDVLIAEGRVSEALPLAEVQLEKAKESRRRFERVNTAEQLALLLHAQGDSDAARQVLEDALDGENDIGRATSLRTRLAAVTGHQGDTDAAARVLGEIGRDWRRLRSPGAVVRLLETVGKVAASEGRARDAARMLGAAEGYRRLVGAQRDTQELATFARVVDAVRTALGEHEFTSSFDDGAALTFSQALAESLG